MIARDATHDATGPDQPSAKAPPAPSLVRASAACRLAGLGESAFNSLRGQLEQALDPASGELIPAPKNPAARRQVVLIAPPLGGFRIPGRDWLYDAEVAAAFTRGPRAQAPLLAAFVDAVRVLVSGPKSGERRRRRAGAATAAAATV